MKSDEGLVRAVGVRGLSAGIVNYTIGAGIFVLPAVVAGRVGAAAWVVYIICALAMAAIVLCFADAGSRVSMSGGTYAYAGLAFGPFIGFIVAISLWFGSAVLASAAVSNVFVDTLAKLVPAFADPVWRAVTLVLLYATFTAVNIRGVRLGSGVVQTVTAAKLTPLLILIGIGLFFVRPENLAWPGMPSSGELARTSVILLFAFLGVEAALTPSGEVKNPAKTVPKAIFVSLALVTLIYLALQFVAQGILGSELAENATSPLAATAGRILGRTGEILVLVATAISTLGYVAGDMLAAPRTVYALGRDRLLPSVFGSVHERFKTPHVAIVLHAVMCFGFAVTGSFTALIVLATLAALIVYLICCLATIQLQRLNIRAEGAIPFKVPGGPVIPVIASAIVIWLMSASTRQEFIAMGAMLAITSVLYLVMRMQNKGAAAL